ncbi:MAG: glycoside hydrolase family 3 C-terminal domain-containing protein [Ignavibacteriales bacterium]|nr:glycoside hydrolase family 3 C-terminal domain-containing protein [Ignavibacteriales bacterium]
MTRHFLLSYLLMTFLSVSTSHTQEKIENVLLPFQNPDLSIEDRVNDLVSRMTLDEKIKQLLYNAPAIDRLDIPEYNWWNEGLHGVARAGRATVFPQSIGLSATWDTELMHRVATVIADEARAKHHDAVRNGRRGIYEGLTFWAPNINIFRDPRWGRGMETYGEDPYLTGRLAVEFIKGMQGDDPHYFKTIATPKHFAVHSGPEPERHVFNAVVDERDLRETYLPHFRDAVVDGNAQSVMCAYNRFRGTPCCGSNELLQKILHDEWDFDGYVVSDCWAIKDFYDTHKIVKSGPEAAAMALKAGTDLNCGVTYDSLGIAVRLGLVGEELVDRSVKRIFQSRFKLGTFDPPERVPFAKIPITVNDSKEHREIALEAARKSIVLLKNDGALLPLSKNLKSIAVIGPNANDVEVLLGNYNGTPTDPVTPLAGILNKVKSKTKIFYVQGCNVAENIPLLEVVPSSVLFNKKGTGNENGLAAEYFNINNFLENPAVTRIDSAIDFNWWDKPAVTGLKADSFSVRWTGILIPPVSGKYSIGLNVFGGSKLFLDDSLLVEINNSHVVQTDWKNIELFAGKSYKIQIEFCDRRADASVRFVWSKPNPHLKQEAIEAAKQADVVVMCLGLSPRLEGEEMNIDVAGFSGGDRVDIGLPKIQEDLLKDIAKTGKPIVLVLLNGSALAVNWADENIPAIIEAWYPGQAAGSALADVLFGDYNPAGRLPVTFYKSVDQLPPFSNYGMKERTYKYFTGEPLYPFGYGLSYTNFDYSNLKLETGNINTGESLSVSVDVSNIGKRAGDEVVQLYIKHLNASVPVPLRSLQGFQRIFLKPDEVKTVKFLLTPRQLSVIDANNKRVVEAGKIEISVGGKQPGFVGREDTATTGVISGKFEIIGLPFPVNER